MSEDGRSAARGFVVFADGAAKGNPGPGGWGAIIQTDDDQIIELGGGEAHTTNNRMELTAPIEALRQIAARPGLVHLYSDSKYVIQGITAWVWGWRKRGWITAQGSPVLNRELWEELLALVMARGRSNVQWHHVRGHVGIPGNERADEIANDFALGRPAGLFRGACRDYSVDLSDLGPSSDDFAKPAEPVRRSAAGSAYSYLSLVGGEVQRHPSWAECERRVKGVRGARFKKAMSATDEASILRSWGVDPGRLA